MGSEKVGTSPLTPEQAEEDLKRFQEQQEEYFYNTKFDDFGIVYRYEKNILLRYYPITPAAKNTLLRLYSAIPLPGAFSAYQEISKRENSLTEAITIKEIDTTHDARKGARDILQAFEPSPVRQKELHTQ
ncbi:hypothetical protein BC939DRAFT_527113 [Gamsiella multidivaricata]|uniref:uncharacterized protein n=1 Tax=Gamsiella multidivaricata TaxID=101098 RepID=UPI002220B09A|nr:uncharacterized protein BC939DRAFT_527113 [Gamsiella multidivaricata]KAI7827639.1 hypothetical protein BC939DRAFT_527113 [Gamsiella multidivaricata]